MLAEYMDIIRLIVEALDAGQLQELALKLIPRICPDIILVGDSGSCPGTSKTRKGIPDIYGKTKAGNEVYVSVTSDSKKGKMYEDTKKSVNQLKELNLNENALCLSFDSNVPQRTEVVQCKKLCASNGCKFKVINNLEIYEVLKQPSNDDLKSQLLSIDASFLSKQNKEEYSKLSDKLDLLTKILDSKEQDPTDEEIEVQIAGLRTLIKEKEHEVTKFYDETDSFIEHYWGKDGTSREMYEQYYDKKRRMRELSRQINGYENWIDSLSNIALKRIFDDMFKKGIDPFADE